MKTYLKLLGILLGAHFAFVVLAVAATNQDMNVPFLRILIYTLVNDGLPAALGAFAIQRLLMKDAA